MSCRAWSSWLVVEERVAFVGSWQEDDIRGRGENRGSEAAGSKKRLSKRRRTQTGGVDGGRRRRHGRR